MAQEYRPAPTRTDILGTEAASRDKKVASGAGAQHRKERLGPPARGTMWLRHDFAPDHTGDAADNTTPEPATTDIAANDHRTDIHLPLQY
jgi:hypothetical protein